MTSSVDNMSFRCDCWGVSRAGQSTLISYIPCIGLPHLLIDYTLTQNPKTIMQAYICKLCTFIYFTFQARTCHIEDGTTDNILSSAQKGVFTDTKYLERDEDLFN